MILAIPINKRSVAFDTELNLGEIMSINKKCLLNIKKLLIATVVLVFSEMSFSAEWGLGLYGFVAELTTVKALTVLEKVKLMSHQGFYGKVPPDEIEKMSLDELKRFLEKTSVYVNPNKYKVVGEDIFMEHPKKPGKFVKMNLENGIFTIPEVGGIIYDIGQFFVSNPYIVGTFLLFHSEDVGAGSDNLKPLPGSKLRFPEGKILKTAANTNSAGVAVKQIAAAGAR
jgi:hypothetical protein